MCDLGSKFEGHAKAKKASPRVFGQERNGWRCRLQKLEDISLPEPPKWNEYIPKKNRHSESVRGFGTWPDMRGRTPPKRHSDPPQTHRFVVIGAKSKLAL